MSTWIETKTLKFWEASKKWGDEAKISQTYNVSIKDVRKAIYRGEAQPYLVEYINSYFRNSLK